MSNIKVYNKKFYQVLQEVKLVDMGDGKFNMIHFEGSDGTYYLVARDSIGAIAVEPIKDEEETDE